jgi:hypothetical protein
MRVIEVLIYNIDELSEKAKEKAFNKWLNDNMYPWNSDNEKTLNTFAEIFPVRIKNWEYGYQNFINFDFIGAEEYKEIKGIKLLKFLYNNYFEYLFKGRYYSLYSRTNGKSLKSRYSKIIFDNCCTLTGYWLDQDILQPIYDFLKKPNKCITFYDLMKKCLNNWVKACKNDFESYNTEENFIEESQINEWEYTAEGNIY